MPKIPRKRNGSETKKRIPRNRGRRITAARASFDRAAHYELDKAIELLKNLEGIQKTEGAKAKYDQTVEAVFQLGVDPRKSDQMVRGAVVMPHGTGKQARVLVFAKGEKVQEAKDAGADFVGGEEIVQKIQKEGWLDFDKAIATPDMMRHVGRIGKILGPRSLMPSPKVGTVTFDVANAVKELKAGKVEFRVEKAGIIHAPIGKISFGEDKIKENLLSLLETIMRLKPQTSKGVYLKKASVSLTQSPGVRLDVTSLQASLRS